MSCSRSLFVATAHVGIALRRITSTRPTRSAQAIGVIGREREQRVRVAELGFHEIDGVRKSTLKIGRILRTTHSEVREMVQEVAEGVLAVRGVLLRIEDVGVPELIDLLDGDDGSVGILDVQDEETAILFRDLLCEVTGPSLALA